MTALPLPFAAMILVGGFGTRLRSVVSDRPKPMALVGEKPFLEILVDSFASKGVRDFVMLAGYKSDMIRQHFEMRQYHDVNIRFSPEHVPLGTGGSVRNAAKFATDPTLVANGDTFFDADLEKLFRYHKDNRAEVTLSLVRVEDVSRYGAVVPDGQGRVIGFTEKGEGGTGPGLINGGLSLMSRDFIMGLPDGVPFSMEREIFPSLARSGRMFGLAQERPFFDIGTPESYAAFQSFAGVQGRLKP
jgi:D-glycero-alpha-D-manno-heptose 1-phosphate guanylyltransferase